MQVPLDAIQGDLEELGLNREIVEKLTTVLTNNSVEAIAEVLGPDSEAVKEIEKLMSLAKDYGISDWIIFDASVVRGLAYYTGLVFEAFDRKGVLRAIAGGGRYDKLLETFGGDPTPAAGFGFGDAVIVELLKDRDLLPTFETSGFDSVVFAMTEALQGKASSVASTLRKAGQSVDVILEPKKIKWVVKYANRIGVKNVVIIAPDEWADGEVSIKDMEEGSQESVKLEGLTEWAEKNVA
jgi:histidyl-tRNA synthetase